MFFLIIAAAAVYVGVKAISNRTDEDDEIKYNKEIHKNIFIRMDRYDDISVLIKKRIAGLAAGAILYNFQLSANTLQCRWKKSNLAQLLSEKLIPTILAKFLDISEYGTKMDDEFIVIDVPFLLKNTLFKNTPIQLE